MSTKIDLELEEGKTFRCRIRWYGQRHIYVPIQSISNTGPVRIITQTDHGLPPGWACAVASSKGLTELNAAGNPPGKKEYRPVTVVAPNTVEFNDCNSTDFGVHEAGSGYLQFFEPMPLLNTQPRWVVYDKLDGSLLLEATVANGHIVVNDTDKYYDILLDAPVTEKLDWTKGVHELESRDTTIPFTYKVIHGKITVVQELAVTTP